MQTSVKQRLIEYLKFIGKGQNKFEREAGISNGYISNLLHAPKEAQLTKILQAAPGLSRVWLLTGEGEMMSSDLPLTPAETRPRIPYDAAAGTITESMEGVTAYQCEQIPVIPIFPRYDFTIRIYGDSMEPEYHSGDEVACLNINTTHFIQWGRVHVLDTMQGIVIKRIYEDGDNIRCRSYNKDYPDFLVPKEEIRSFNLVVGSLRI